MKIKMLNSLSTIAIIIFASIIIAPSSAYARGGGGEFLVYPLITLVIVIVIFLICRELVCWYWKINEVVGLLSEIRDLLRALKTASKRGELPSKSESQTEAFQQSEINSEPLVASENEIEELKKSAGEDAVTFSYATEDEWVCVCGTRNQFDRSKQVQNCSNCHRNRIHVLSKYGKN